MPLPEKGRLAEDAWVAVADGAALPDAPVIVSLARLLRDAPALAGRKAPLGVAIENTVNPDALAPFLPRLVLVQVTMPGSGDGRAFAQVRALREGHGFAGEIRVTGHVTPDHYAALLRCGASSVVVPEGTDPAASEARRVAAACRSARAAAQPLFLLCGGVA